MTNQPTVCAILTIFSNIEFASLLSISLFITGTSIKKVGKQIFHFLYSLGKCNALIWMTTNWGHYNLYFLVIQLTPVVSGFAIQQMSLTSNIEDQPDFKSVSNFSRSDQHLGSIGNCFGIKSAYICKKSLKIDFNP